MSAIRRCDWKPAGTRRGLVEDIARTTGIDEALQRHASSEFIQSTSIAKRISWAVGRETTRKEDETYCLLGLLGVQMELLYGEQGGAFLRLQKRNHKYVD
jgi:hypothetical protein